MAHEDVMKNFHLPLPADLHRELRDAAGRSGRPATELAREAVRAWLVAHKRAERHAAIVAFAEAHAGSALDLDPELEGAAVEHLVEVAP